MLEEMGLTPVWRLRDATPPAAGDTGAAEPQDSSVDSRHATHESPPVAGADRRAQIMSLEWPALKTRVAQCTDCVLHQKRNKTVFGVGDENADWLFVGEGPGADEDAQGEPFVGRRGERLLYDIGETGRHVGSMMQ